MTPAASRSWRTMRIPSMSIRLRGVKPNLGQMFSSYFFSALALELLLSGVISGDSVHQMSGVSYESIHEIAGPKFF